MKTSINQSARTSGSILVTTLVIAVVIGATLASYLALTSNQNKLVARSQIWNSALTVSEAGIEDGMQLLNKKIDTGNLPGWSTDYLIDGWTRPGGGNLYQLTRYMNAAHTTYYKVYITNSGVTPTVRAVSYVPGPTWVASGPPISRTIEVKTTIDSLFNACMAALGNIDLKGNNVASDSFDSNDPLYSTNGLYIASKRKAGGDIVTNNTITNSVLAVGNANVAGHIQTGPSGNFTILSGSVGDLPWVDANTPGVKPGWANNDMNVVFDNVVLPPVPWIPAVGPGTGGPGIAPDGKSYAHIFTSALDTIASPGNYLITDSGDTYVGTNVSVRLNITCSDYKPDKIFVAGVSPSEAGRYLGFLNGPSGMSVTLGTDNKTQSGRAWNLMFMGLPNCTDISYKGNGDFTGAIYAPQADFHLAGGGSSFVDFIGSSVTRTVQMNGHYHFHYDEGLRSFGPNRGYIVTAWREF